MNDWEMNMPNRHMGNEVREGECVRVNQVKDRETDREFQGTTIGQNKKNKSRRLK